MRASNSRRILYLFVEHGILARGQIVGLTGLSKPTVSQALARLESSGLVRCVGVSTELVPGPNPALYELDGAAGQVAGIDITDRRVVVGVADLAGHDVGRAEHPVNRDDPIGTVQAALTEATAQAGTTTANLLGIVAGLPVAVHPETEQLAYASRLHSWAPIGLAERLRSALGARLTLENDVNLAAIAEQHHGGAVGRSSFVVLWAATGVGLAVMIGGRLHRGATGSAGEIGYAPLVAGGMPSPHACPEFADGETVASLAHRFGLAVDADAAPHAGDESILDRVAEEIATRLGAVTAIVDPELIVLNGESLRAGGETLRGLIESKLARLDVPHPPVVLSTVEGNPVVHGAIDLALTVARADIFASAVA